MINSYSWGPHGCRTDLQPPPCFQDANRRCPLHSPVSAPTGHRRRRQWTRQWHPCSHLNNLVVSAPKSMGITHSIFLLEVEHTKKITTSFNHPNSPWRMVKISAGHPKRRSGPRTLLNPAWAAQVRKKLVWCRMLVLGLIPSKYTHSSQKITTRFTPHMGITTIVVQNGQISHWTFRDHTNFRWATPSATVPRIWSRQKGPKTPYAFPRRTRANLVHGQSLNTAMVHFFCETQGHYLG